MSWHSPDQQECPIGPKSLAMTSLDSSGSRIHTCRPGARKTGTTSGSPWAGIVSSSPWGWHQLVSTTQGWNSLHLSGLVSDLLHHTGLELSPPHRAGVVSTTWGCNSLRCMGLVSDLLCLTGLELSPPHRAGIGSSPPQGFVTTFFPFHGSRLRSATM